MSPVEGGNPVEKEELPAEWVDRRRLLGRSGEGPVLVLVPARVPMRVPVLVPVLVPVPLSVLQELEEGLELDDERLMLHQSSLVPGLGLGDHHGRR
jgi:hypothetical protein